MCNCVYSILYVAFENMWEIPWGRMARTSGQYSSGVTVEWYVLEAQKGSFEHWQCRRLEVALSGNLLLLRGGFAGSLDRKKTTFLVLYSYRNPTRHAQDLPGPCIGASLQLSSKHSTPGQIMTNLASYKTSARINRNQQEATSQCLLGSLTASGHGLFQRPLFLDLAAGPYIGSLGLQHVFVWIQ